MNKKIIIGIVIVAVVAVAIGMFALGGFNPNAPPVGLSVSSNGYSNTLNGSPNYHFEITVTNSGTTTARNVRFTVKFYGANHAIIGVRETASVGDIPAGTTKNFSIDVPCPAQPVYSAGLTPLYDV